MSDNDISSEGCNKLIAELKNNKLKNIIRIKLEGNNSIKINEIEELNKLLDKNKKVNILNIFSSFIHYI